MYKLTPSPYRLFNNRPGQIFWTKLPKGMAELTLFFSKSFIFEKFFQEYHLSVKQIDLGPNCLQR